MFSFKGSNKGFIAAPIEVQPLFFLTFSTLSLVNAFLFFFFFSFVFSLVCSFSFCTIFAFSNSNNLSAPRSLIVNAFFLALELFFFAKALAAVSFLITLAFFTLS